MEEIKMNCKLIIEDEMVSQSRVTVDENLINQLYERDDLEIEMNREWLYNDNDNNIGEINFVVSKKFAEEFYNSNYKEKYPTFKDFLSAYIPEEEGQELYSYALSCNGLIDDLGEVYYNE